VTSLAHDRYDKADGIPSSVHGENEIWRRAELTALVFAVDPATLGGVHLCAGVGPVREFWLSQCRALLDPDAPLRRMPSTIDTDRLLGGLDLTATLATGRPAMQSGLLAECDGGVLIIPMAERIMRETAAHVASALDLGKIQIERQAGSACLETRFGVIALDESGSEPEGLPTILNDRLALRLTLDGLSVHARQAFDVDRSTVTAAQQILPGVKISDDIISALIRACLSVGEVSLRRVSQCVLVARIHAALCERSVVDPEDAVIAATLVIGIVLSNNEDNRETEETKEGTPDSKPLEQDQHAGDNPDNDQRDDDTPAQQSTQQQLEDRVIDAIKGVAVSHALADLYTDTVPLNSGQAGVSGQSLKSRMQGRAKTVRRGDPRRDGHLDILATLRAGAPWQKLRTQIESAMNTGMIQLRPDDFHVKICETKSQTVVIFVVDASGSSALNRMAEAKGAVEQLLADCYARRDQVALIAFRDKTAQLLLPPTRSLVRARRNLAQLPGGGGTPLAAGLHEALMLARAEQTKGSTPYIIVLSDGRGNIDLSQQPGREQAQADAMICARRIKAAGFSALFFDTSARPDPRPAQLAQAMGASRRPLPRADGAAMSKAVKSLTSKP